MINDSELETFAKRLSIAYWLKKGRSYENIKTNIKVSSATIATIEKLSKKPGFAAGVKKMEAEEWANVWAEKIQKFIRK
ncbi:MAG: Trp family transcriptional regulator [Candidatus Woesebacteria bacterium]|nr:Trp family transcriptional regulator [Candidatus Woesebacteria bacterium]